jgi:hypothetical protein
MRGFDAVEGQLRGAAEERPDRRRILHSGQLHQNATRAERLHGRFRHADRIDAATNDFDALLQS